MNVYISCGYVLAFPCKSSRGLPERGVSGIKALEGTDGTVVRITYSNARPSMQKMGMILELASSTFRETAGAFTWESQNVTASLLGMDIL